MKALTIHQRYAAAIIHGPKRIENRKWFCRHRGLLLIHAGKSTDSLDCLTDEERESWPEWESTPLVFGALIGVVHMADCERYEGPGQGVWAHGPNCFVLQKPIALAEPIPWVGALGLFDVPDEIITAQLPDLVDRYKSAPPTAPVGQRFRKATP